ncbi:MAG: hypothetical protein ACKVS8_02260 [Phycisphaerales bacterium]
MRVGLMLARTVRPAPVVAALCLAAAVLGGGCTQNTASEQASWGPRGGQVVERGTEALFQSAQVNAALAGVDGQSLPEFSRRDGALALASPRSPVAADVWPQAEQASLERQRYYNVNTSSSSYLFFTPERYGYRSWYSGGRYPYWR